MHLRDVLNAFQRSGPQSLAQMSKDLDVDPGALDGMIQFWVRKGKLREVCDFGCSSCGAHGSCPVVTLTPRRYELVAEGSTTSTRPADEPPPRSCCH